MALGRWPRAIIFDLDGVLVDSEPWWADSRAEVARRHGADWSPADEAAVKGANSREWASAMCERLDLPVGPGQVEREVVAAMVRRYQQEPPPAMTAGIAAVERLRRSRPLGLASSAHPDVISSAVAALGLDGAFDVIVSADEVRAGKPAPDVYIEAAGRLGVPRDACLVIEDSPSGVMAAQRAGMRVAWVGASAMRDGRPTDRGVLRLASLDELDEAAIDRLAAEA